MFKQKFITVEEAVSKIKDNDYIYTYGASGEPTTFLSNINLIKNKLKNVTIVNFLNTLQYDFYTDDLYTDVINNESLFFNKFCSKFQKAGRMSFVPNHLGNSIEDRLVYHNLRKKPFNIYVLSVTPMDKHGYFSTSTVALSNRTLIKHSDLVILEINDNLPRTFGDTQIHITEVDYVFQGSNKVIYLPSKKTNDTDKIIAEYISDLIDDGSTIQLGIGGIPNAVALSLANKKDLGVHTEMLNDGIVDLYKKGVITNRLKTHYKDKMVTTFTFGSKETYDFLDDNLGILHLSVEQSNSPYEIAKNKKMISINTTLQVDLMGQCLSESIGNLQISGTGGQVETARGAQMSDGGKSIIALHSTAIVKDINGRASRKSTIVAAHPQGAVITLSRCDIDYVVTEYGVAQLKGASIRERALSLIKIAHPDYREDLIAQAKEYSYL